MEWYRQINRKSICPSFSESSGIFLGETGTGKTDLMTALCVEACRHNKRVPFTTVPKHQAGSWTRHD